MTRTHDMWVGPYPCMPTQLPLTWSPPAVADPLELSIHHPVLTVPAPQRPPVAHPLLAQAAVRGEEAWAGQYPPLPPHYISPCTHPGRCRGGGTAGRPPAPAPPPHTRGPQPSSRAPPPAPLQHNIHPCHQLLGTLPTPVVLGVAGAVALGEHAPGLLQPRHVRVAADKVPQH